MSIPGAGQKMVHEFKEYRPWKTKEQFDKEIGKYVGPKEDGASVALRRHSVALRANGAANGDPAGHPDPVHRAVRRADELDRLTLV
jgi:hypothetical protein